MACPFRSQWRSGGGAPLGGAHSSAARWPDVTVTSDGVTRNSSRRTAGAEDTKG